MLSAEADAAASCKPGKAKGVSSWLPELNSPKLSIALPPIGGDSDALQTDAPATAHGDADIDGSKKASDAVVDAKPDAAAPAASQDIVSASVASSNAADYYYHLDSVTSEASVALEDPPKAPSVAEPSTDVQEAPSVSESHGEVDMQTMLDHLGLDFDFASDPAIDDINATPLFAIPPSVAANKDPETGASQGAHKGDLDSDNQARRSVLAETPSSSGVKTRTRRSSIASMLMRRTSKCFDSIGASSVIESPVIREQKVEAQNQSQADIEAKVQDKPEPEVQPQAQAQSQSVGAEPASGSSDAKDEASVSSEASAAAKENQAVVEGNDAPPPYAHAATSSDADASDDIAEETGTAVDVPAAAAADASSVFVAKAHAQPPAGQPETDSADSSAAENSEKPALASADNADPHISEEASSASYNDVSNSSGSDGHNNNNNDHSSNVQPSNATSAASLSYEANKSEIPAGVEPSSTYSIPTRRPPKARNLDRRSSRILDELTRKVQHVRQTTSMVLRRSVGSRLSVIHVGSSDKPAAGSADDS
ncbi:hypothetical protein LPJ56_005422, partial [Coemansia sp. RSA 2599]